MRTRSYQELFQEAKAGDPIAQLDFGKALEAGAPDIPKNLVRARLWYSRAAEQGNAEAKDHLHRLEEKEIPLGWIDDVVDIAPVIGQAGYPIKSEGGVCHGVAMKAIEAGLIGQLATFDARILKIDRLFRQGKLRALPETKDIPEDKDWDVRAFLDSVALHYEPGAFAEILQKKYRQSNEMEISSYFTSSIELETKHNGIHKVHPPIVSAYNLAELRDYFDLLTRKTKTYGHDISYNFCCNKHSIALIYEAKNDVWHVIDPAELPSKIVEPSQLTQVIKKCFAENYGFRSDNFVLSTRVYSTQRTAPLAEAFIHELRETDEFKEAHDLTLKKANCKNSEGVSLITVAIQESNVELFRKIMAKVKTEDQFKALDETGHNIDSIFLYGNEEEMKILFNTPGFDIKKIPLMQVVTSRNAEMLKILVDAKADVNILDANGTAVFQSLLAKDLASFKILIDAGARINEDRESVKFAIRNGVEFVKVMLTAPGFDVNLPDAEGQVPIIVAAIAGNTETLAALIAGGADLNTKGTAGFSAIGTAIYSYQIDALRMLVEKGAAIEEIDFQTAIAINNLEMLEILTRNFDVRNNANIMDFALSSDNLAAVTLLLRAGAPVNFADIYAKNNVAAMTLLVQAGLETRPHFEYALRNNNFSSLNLLLSSGVKPKARDVCGAFYAGNIATAIYLEKFCVQTVPDVLGLLTEYGTMSKSRLSLCTAEQQEAKKDAIAKIEILVEALKDNLKNYSPTTNAQLQIVQNIYHCIKQTYDTIYTATNRTQADASVEWCKGQVAELQTLASNFKAAASATFVTSDKLGGLLESSLKHAQEAESKLGASVPPAPPPSMSPTGS